MDWNELPTLTRDQLSDTSSFLVCDESRLAQDGPGAFARVLNEDLAGLFGGAKVEVFDTPGTGTWSPPANLKTLTVLIRGAVGGAGSGRRGAAGSTRSGGGGSGAAPINVTRFAYNPFPPDQAPIPWKVGAKGLGGAPAATDDTNGNPGTAGEDSFFGDLLASGSNFGAGGTSSTANGGAAITAASYVDHTHFNSAAGGNGQSGGGLTGGIGTTNRASGGGGAGGGLDASNNPGNGGNGGASGQTTTLQISGGAGGINGPGSKPTRSPFLGEVNAGSGGGSGRVGGAGYAGADGEYGGGAGGGGASENGFPSGKGGDGTDALIVLVYTLG